MLYTKKRYLTYIFITLFTLIVPFIKVNGNHLLLLSFEKLQFHFIGLVFNINELYLMPFLLMFFFIGIFAVTSMFGRAWCGWACPQTIFRVIYRDLIENTLLDLGKIKNKQKYAKYSESKNIIKKLIAIFLWSIISLIVSINFIWYFVPPEDFFSYIQNPDDHIFMIIWILSISGFLLFDILIMKEKFCVYVCPYSRIQSVLYDDNTKQIVYDTKRGGKIYNNGEKTIFNIKQWAQNEECTTCEACVKVCPTHIDIRKGLQVECINCLECSDACSIVMGKLGKKSLINWGSTNKVLNKLNISLLTSKNIMYAVALIASLIFAGIFTLKKENIIINVNKTTKLYNIKNNGIVSNNYILTIHNTQDKTYTYDIKLLNTSDFRVKRFKPITLKGNKKAKRVLIIEATKKLSFSNIKDTTIKIEALIFSKEDSKINLTQKLFFTYPKDIK